MHGTWNDLRSGFRILARHPGPTALAVSILALGIGLTTAMFSIVYGLVLRGLPLEDADELVHIEAGRPDRGSQLVTLPQLLDWRAGQTAFRELHAFQTIAVYLSGEGLPERLEGARITPGAFAHLGIAPRLGREIEAGDAELGAEPVAVLGHGVWQRRFAADPGILGRTVRLDGRPTTVIGVMPAGFQFPERQDIWLPQPLDAGATPRDEASPELHVFGRLRDGIDLGRARADLAAVNARLGELHPQTAAGLHALIVPYSRYFIGEDEVSLGWTSLGAVSFVLLIACFNVANLLLVRASHRSRELALRAALGAGRWRTVRQALAESFVLALFAAALGVGLASWVIQRFNAAVAEREWPFWLDVRLDGASLLFVLGCTVLASVLAGSIPAWRSSRLDVASVLKDAARSGRRQRLNRGLVVGEVVLSCVLLTGAGLMVRTLVNLSHLDFAFDAERLYAGRITLLPEPYPDPPRLVQAWAAIEGALAGVPEVERAVIADRVPAAEWAPLRRYAVDQQMPGSERELPLARRVRVRPGYFATLGVEPVAGRSFTASDVESGAPVAVVNRSFAERHGSVRGVIGQTVRFASKSDTESWRTVIGVVPDLNAGGPSDQKPAAVYVPLELSTLRSGVLLARVHGDVEAAGGPLRDAVAAVDPDLPIYFGGAVRPKISQQLFFYRMVGTVFIVMAVAALLLAASGLYGLLSFAVSARAGEIGVRMALGASAREVLVLIVGGGLRQVALGLAVGFVLALFVTRLIEHQLFGVRPFDVPTFLAVGLTLLGSGLAAAFVPALRASQIDPNGALRGE